jgi:hypothetical protein
MAEGSVDELGFACPACGAELAWSPRVAGRRVSCPCGHVFVGPLRSAVVGEPPPEPPREAPGRAAELAKIYGRPKRREVEDEEEAGGVVRNVVAPSVLLAVGLLVALSQVSWRPPQPVARWMDVSLPQMAVILLVLVLSLLGAVGAFVKLMNVEFGRLGPALYKLVAIPVFAGSIAIAVARLDRSPWSITGMAMGWHLLVVLYWGLFSALFKLELWETLLVCFVVAVVQAAALGAILG